MRVPVCINFLCGLGILYHSAYAATLQCPQVIQTNQSLHHEIKDWDVFTDDLNGVHQFERITFYSGHPKENASLAPNHENSKAKKLTWTFGKKETWTACDYAHTKVQLIRKLPAGTKSCTVTYNANFSKVMAIKCI
ncbi:STY0301 family protein [Legionella sp. PC1000]|uniref:STY0301 family protein n=1 Tax=Legionella sp. PC1000 TaxID=2746060 RepID=UPI0015F82581|nr:STY0301 family protein [Legionella sp. PC1000]